MLVLFCLLFFFCFCFLFLGETKVDCKWSLKRKGGKDAYARVRLEALIFGTPLACPSSLARVHFILPSHLSLRDHSRPTAKLLYEKNELSISYFCRRVCFGISCDRSSISHAINRSFYHAPVPWITGIPTTVTTEKGQTPDPCYLKGE